MFRSRPLRHVFEDMDATEIRAKILEVQRKFATICTILMAIGGFVIGLGFHLRHLLRLVPPGYLMAMIWRSNIFFASGIIQITYTATCCFASIWQLDHFVFVGELGTVLVMIVELTSVILAIILQFPSAGDTTEHIYRAWYVWECADVGSCRKAYMAYIRVFLIPQAILTFIALILHGFTFYYITVYLELACTLRERIENGVNMARREANQATEESRV